ncbi:MAG: LytR C-terminal domain-containing protein [Gemmatimonadota bacterium]|nr:LytR C-terminal domain-containing protein [Gemmatimonadota bacterium]
MKRSRVLLGLALVFVVIAGSAFALRARRGLFRPTVVAKADSAARAPAGKRVRVEVINTTHTRGLARRATRVLRDQGFDVVSVSTGGPSLDSTLVLDRSGHQAWAAAIARLLGPRARAELRPDSSRYLDVTVLLGTSWHPPTQPLYP